MERVEELGLNGIKILQDDNLYKFTSDSVLLTKFAKVKKNDVVADFCSGSGIVGLHLYCLNSQAIKSVTLFEMQTPLYEMSQRSIALNNLQEVFSAVNCRVQDIDNSYNERFSLIVCNPPYMKTDGGMGAEKPHVAMCKREEFLPLPELLKSISKCLKFGGRACIVHRADRLIDLTAEMRNNNIEPKRLQVVSAKGKSPYLVMVEGVKGGKSGLTILPQIEN